MYLHSRHCAVLSFATQPHSHLAMTTITRDSFEATVIRICREHKLNHCHDANYHAYLLIGGYVVKYDYYKSLEPQVKTQRHVYDYAKTQENAPRIPKVEYFFQDDEGIGYLVMERVTVLPTPKNLAERAAEALNWLALVPAPSNNVIGPLGGVIRHWLFKNGKAPLVFSSVGALERYINRGRMMISKLRPVTPVSFDNEPVILTQSDMDASNFGVDEAGKTVLFGFGQIGWLPLSLAKFTMSSTVRFTADVAKFLRWSCSSNEVSMREISICLWMASEPSLGLDENGYPRPKGSIPKILKPSLKHEV
ncbi:hypothetical protein F5887DRAFT_1073874 [Amanita rubescens]|nr:hypothetical protein F5887DRAFT_1073874 [Amanita rubescens]